MTSAQETKTCQNCKTEFRIDPDDFAFYEKMKIPPPTFCPDCRYQRRLANRNEWNFYRRNCDLCGKSAVTLYSEEFPGPVYCQPCWWGDGWDPFSYARDFDFSRPFFEQFQELRLAVPHVAMANWHSTNSEYTNQSLSNRNCYMCVSTASSENCLYGYWLDKVRESLDCWKVFDGEFMYESLNVVRCSRSAYLEDCTDTTEGFFLKDCRGCASCFGSYGLRNKTYVWANEQLSREEYEKRFSEFVFTRQSIAEERKKLEILARQYPHKYYHGANTVRSSGDYISDIKDSRDVFNASEAENLRYCQDARYSKDSFDCTETYAEASYENEGTDAHRCIALTKSLDVFDTSYSELCSNSHDMFGCVGLRKAEYVILNKRYDKETYHVMRERIIEHMKNTGEWGEFFPAENALFAYNETVAQDYFPLTKEEARAHGVRWYNRSNRGYVVSLEPDTIPETIAETPDSIVDAIIGCRSQRENPKYYLMCATAFRILPAELDLYRKMSMPIPDKCSSCRRQDRMTLRNPRRLWKRVCQCAGVGSSNGAYMNLGTHAHGAESCSETFDTSYAPDRQETVYCEQCYQSEVI